MDTNDHMFMPSNLANAIWQLFSNSLGIQHAFVALPNLLIKWFCIKPHNEVHKILLQAVPAFLCWQLWKK